MRRTPAAAVAVALLVLGGCGNDSGGSGGASDPGGADPTTDAPIVPGEGGPSWAPVVPEGPVDPDTVLTTYAPVVDAAVAATDGDLTWADATVTTETFDDLCVVEVERVGEGGPSPDPDILREALDAAVSGAGFTDLDVAQDPGGALTFVAHDDADALLEWRSKTDTTVAVRVATAPSECAG